jgi:hypothetical protein
VTIGSSPVEARPRERGVALISVLGVLGVLLVLAALVAGSSRMETALSGTSRDSERAFAAADAGLGLALGVADNFVNIDGTGCDNDPPPPCTHLTAATFGVDGDVCVCFDHEGPPPVTIKVSAIRIRAFHFNMDATGEAPGNARSTLLMEAVRLGPAQ